jgi:hypothetical protein
MSAYPPKADIRSAGPDLLAVNSLPFVDRMLRVAGECRILGAEATIAADHRPTAGLEGVKDAILVNSASPGIRPSTPRPLRRLTRAKQEVECICRCGGAKTNRRANSRTND